ncbi:MAG: GEVED domain-containing protein [Cryomorphaceae bacterium]
MAFPQAGQTVTFNYTGAAQTFTVPTGVTSLIVDMAGAQGGPSNYSGVGGLGGRVQCTLSVTGGQVLNLYVGGAGASPAGGFNGGGTGTAPGNNGGGGGGATDIRVGGTALANRSVVAGGGGGGSQGNGGAGGGLTGAQGSTNGSGIWATGGTQSAGGSGGLYNTGSCAPGAFANNGSLGVGGNGISGGGACTNYGGSGGGGGYYGGGGMQINGAGGGSSYSDASASGVVHTQGYQSGNGFITFTYDAYCAPSYTTGCSVGDQVQNFSTTGGTTNITNNGSGCSANNYGDYTSLVHTQAFGDTVNFSVQSGATYAQGFTIWVDWNENYVYESNELMWNSGTASTAAFTGSFVIPFAISQGPRTMRVRAVYAGVTSDPCAFFNAYGEVEEYTIDVTSPYCSPSFTTGCAVGDQIENFSTTGGTTNITNNGSGCNGPVGDFTNLIHTTQQASTVSFSVQSGPVYAQGFGIWVDWDKNGIYDSGEQMWNSGTASTTAFSGSFTVPCDVDTGRTIMRVVATYAGLPSGPCISATYGEAEEYTMHITSETTEPISAPFASVAATLNEYGSVIVDSALVDSASSDNCSVTVRVAESIIPGFEDQVELLGTLGGHTYFLTNAMMSKAAAQALATSMGGYLASISSQAENDFLQPRVSGSFPWIGLTDGAAEGTFVWDNGEAFSYSNWSGGEPNNAGNEDCVQYYYTTGFWNDVLCSNSYPGIIEINQDMEFSESIYYGCSDTGSHYIYLEAQDNNGNTDYEYSLVTVSDVTGPTIQADDFNVYLDASGQAVIPASMLDGSIAKGILYFASTNNPRIWQVDIDSTTPAILFDNAGGGSGGPVGLDYSLILDSIYFGGGNYDSVYRINANGLGSQYVLPNTDGSVSTNNRHEVDIDRSGNRLFFTAGDDGIFVGNLDGTGTSINIYDPPGAGSSGMDFNPRNGRVYINQTTGNTIESLNDDGSDFQTLFNSGDGVSSPRQVVVDPIGEKVYWVNRGTGSIMVGNLDGSGSPSNVYTSQPGIYGIDYYAPADMLYWTRFGASDQIYRAPADGSGTPELLYNSNFGSVRGITTSGLYPAGIYVTDNCGLASFTVSGDTFYCGDLGVNALTINAIDVHGNTSSSSVNVFVLDTLAPTAVAAGDTVFLDALGNGSISSAALDLGSTDNCGVSISVSDSVFDCSHLGSNSIWFYATDPSGNVDSVQLTIEVVDNIAPTVVTQNINVFLDATGNASILPGDIDNGSDDVCGIETLALDVSTFTCANIGSPVTVTLTATDSSNNSDTASAVVTVFDNIAPTVITKNITVNLDFTGNVTIPSDSLDDGSNDACGIQSIVLSDSTFDCSDVGSPVLVYITVTDQQGNSDTGQAYVTVQDLIAPVIFTFDTLVIPLDTNGQYTLTPAEVDSASSDACNPVTYGLDISAFDCDDHNTPIIVTLTGTDPSGNSATGTTVVIVQDTFIPEVITQNITVQLDGTGNASIVANDVDNGSNDGCGIASRSVDISAFDCSDVGSPVTVTLTVTDSSGNSSSNTATVTVEDNVAPSAFANNLTIQLDSATGLASITPDSVDNASSDACGIATLSLSQSTFDCTDALAPVQVVLTVTDSNGNSDTAHAYITVQDVTAPTMIVYDTIEVLLDANGQHILAVSELDSGTFDACPVTYTISPLGLDCDDHGNPMNVTLTATDQSGNTASAVIVVIAYDSVPPIVVTQDVTVFLDAFGQASITANDINNGSSDSCGIDNIGIDTSNFTCASWNTPITVTLYVEDVNGNSNTNTATVTVVDNLPPTASTIGSDTVYLDINGNASVTALGINNSSTDNCAIESWVLNDSTFDCSDVGAPVQIVLTVTDSSGNSDTAHAYVTVFDLIVPTISIQDTAVYLDVSGNATITASYVDIGTSDACSLSSIAINDSVFDCSHHGDTITTWFIATDVNGNVDSQEVDLYILDTVRPAVITQNLTLSLDSFGDTSITPAMVDNLSSDACGILSYALDVTEFTCGDVGANTVVLTVTDSNGNADSATAIVTIVDDIAPVIAIQDVTLGIDTFGTAILTPSMADIGTNDACGIANLVLSDTLFDCTDIGNTYTIGFIATDVNGNVATDSFDVTIVDLLPPIIQAQNITVQLDSFGSFNINLGMVDVGTFDNCGLDTMWITDTTFACADLGPNVVEYIAIDIYGNADTADFTVTVEDVQPPVVTTVPLTLMLDASGQAIIDADSVDNNSSDNCSITATWLSDSIFDCDDTSAVQIITLYAQDQSGNIDSATAAITIIDDLVPIVITNDLALSLDSFGDVSIVANDIDSNSSDNCGIQSMTLSKYDFGCGDVFAPNTVTLYVQDVSGNLDSATAVVTISDDIAPALLAQNITIALDSSGIWTIDSSDVDTGSWDACGIHSLWLEQDTFMCADIGVNTLWYYGLDIHGNVDSIELDITVIDAIAPAISIMDTFYVYLDTFGLATMTADSIDIATADNCSLLSISIDTSEFTCANHGDTLQVTFTAEDAYGNVSTDTCIFIINDTLAPLIFAHSDTFYLDSNGQFTFGVADLNDSTQDACGVDTMYLSDTIVTCSTVDSTLEIQFNAIDIYGNQSAQNLNITVLDTTHPVIVCNDSIVQDNDIDQCGAIVSFSWPTATDNCSIDTIVQIDTTGLDTGSFFPVGITQLTYVAYDQSGNTDTCSFIIEIIDWQTPQILCQSDTLICDTTYVFTYPDYLDNCTGFDVVQIAGIASGAFYPVGATVNRFAVTDSYGNSDTCEYEVFRYDFPSIADAGPDQEKCEEYSTTLVGNVPTVGFGFWRLVSGGATITDSTDASSAVTAIAVGTTELEWRIENGVCPIERDTMQISEYLNPVAANAGIDIVLCDTSEGQLAAIIDSIGIGTWLPTNNGTEILDSTAFNSTLAGLSLGSFSYVWRVVNGVCPITFDTVSLDVVPFTEVSAGEDIFIFHPSNTVLNAASTLPSTFTWSPASALLSTTGDSVIAAPRETTEFVVTAETEFGCKTRDTVMVGVNIGPVLPTAFTPDGDNYNDRWNLKELASYPGCVVSVYNRWGHKIFESDGYGESWDGTYNGEPLPSGSYFYVIDLNVDEVPPQTGSVTIIK